MAHHALWQEVNQQEAIRIGPSGIPGAVLGILGAALLHCAAVVALQMGRLVQVQEMAPSALLRWRLGQCSAATEVIGPQRERSM